MALDLDVALADLQRSCPLVEVTHREVRGVNYLIGKVAGEVVLQADSLHLRVARDEFNAAYYRMKLNGLLKGDQKTA